MHELDEGIFSVDKQTIRKYSKKEADDFIAQMSDQGEKAKIINSGYSKTGQPFFDIQYPKQSKDFDKSITGRISRGAETFKKGVEKAKEVVGKVKDTATTIIANIPKKGILSAPTAFKLGQERAKFVKEHPDVKFGKPYKSDKGWSVDYVAKDSSAEKEARTSQKRISNIQKVINKLSDDKLAKIEDIIKQ